MIASTSNSTSHAGSTKRDTSMKVQAGRTRAKRCAGETDFWFKRRARAHQAAGGSHGCSMPEPRPEWPGVAVARTIDSAQDCGHGPCLTRLKSDRHRRAGPPVCLPGARGRGARDAVCGHGFQCPPRGACVPVRKGSRPSPRRPRGPTGVGSPFRRGSPSAHRRAQCFAQARGRCARWDHRERW